MLWLHLDLASVLVVLEVVLLIVSSVPGHLLTNVPVLVPVPVVGTFPIVVDFEYAVDT